MKPELKFGRRVIAWNENDPTEHRGVFISNDNLGYMQNWVLPDSDDSPDAFDNAKIDLSADPMNGDEVQWKLYSGNWSSLTVKYIGQRSGGTHVIEDEHGELFECAYARFPQQSKRERVMELIRNYPMANYSELAAQIDKIYTEDE